MSEFDTSYTIPVQPAYEGATTSYRMEQRGLQKGDQDTVAARELQNLWARSHYLVRNNACSITAKKRLLTNWIGKGITIRWTHANGDDHKKMQKIWDAWIKESVLDGYGNFYNIQATWGSALFESGESLTRMVTSKRPTSKIPFALQPLESEQLDPLFNSFQGASTSWGVTIPENQTVKNGIGFVGSKPATYYFWKRHPGNSMLGVTGNTRIAVPAEEIIHIFERERPGQWRGVPMLAAVLLNIYEMDELTDATLQRQKAAQAISWIIENTSMTHGIAPGTVRSSTSPSDIDATTGKRRVVIQANAGGAQYLNPGETIKFSSVEDIGSNLQVLLRDEWGKIASALGLAHHQITGDLSEVNFSSIRAGLNELRIRVEMVQQLLFINLGLSKVTARFQELAGIYESKALLEAIPVFYTPRRYGIDDLKDTQADLMEVQAGFEPMEAKLAERGYTLNDIAAGQKKVESLGLKVSSFPPSMEVTPPDTPNSATSSSNGKNPAKTRPTVANKQNPNTQQEQEQV